MDGSRFDTLLWRLSTARSRRGAILGLFGGAFGLLTLTETEAKHRKKKHKPKKPRPQPASPPRGPQCPASCPVCQECINGESCTVQSDFSPCGEDGCNVCQGGACVNRADGASCASTGRCVDGLCNHCPDGRCEHCFDGRQNGDETDVDCGGSCDRCTTGRTCHSRDDCGSAFCAGGICATCEPGADACGSDAQGLCVCINSGTCVTSFTNTHEPFCEDCPAGTVHCAPIGAVVACFPRCGSTFE
jgi:hypothetical protein